MGDEKEHLFNEMLKSFSLVIGLLVNQGVLKKRRVIGSLFILGTMSAEGAEVVLYSKRGIGVTQIDIWLLNELMAESGYVTKTSQRVSPYIWQGEFVYEDTECE